MKILLLIMFLILGGVAWATPDSATSSEYSGNTQVKSAAGVVYSININYVGATAGQQIQMIDGVGSTASTASLSPVRFTCTASASSGNCMSTSGVAYYFGTGIFYKDSGASGTAKTDLQYF